jgi:hypothetical protein
MNKILALLLLITAPAFSQERMQLSGRVISDSNGIGNVFVINKLTGTETKTNGSGSFTIPSKAGDILVVYSPRVTIREFAVSEQSFKEVPYVIEVETSSLELEEVVVDGSSITSEKLGIVPAGQKRYTPAERKLYTAGDFKPVMLVGLLLGSMPLDPVINAMNGRTKRMKELVALEKREMLLGKLENIYALSEITSYFKIPEEHVNGFLYFVIEDKEVAAFMDEKNESMAKFRITELSSKYLELIKDE